MKILILGHTGMLGNAVYKFLNDKYEIEIIEKHRWYSVEYGESILNSNSDFIINCIGAISQKKYDKNYYNLVNVHLPLFLESSGKRIIHPSTDCEFSGNIEISKQYKIDDERDANDEYGISKGRISKIIVNNFKNTKIIRTSIIGHELNSKFSLLDWFLNVKNGETINGYSNYYWNGITTLEWSKIANELIESWDSFDKLIQVGTDGLSKFELLNIIKEVYDKNIQINEYKMDVQINKMLETSIKVPTIRQQLIELKNFYNK